MVAVRVGVGVGVGVRVGIGFWWQQIACNTDIPEYANRHQRISSVHRERIPNAHANPARVKAKVRVKIRIKVPGRGKLKGTGSDLELGAGLSGTPNESELLPPALYLAPRGQSQGQGWIQC